MVAYSVEISSAAERQLRKLPRDAHERVMATLEKLRSNPRPPGCVKVRGIQGAFRVRVGDYRVIFIVLDDKRVVVVSRVAHRKDVYKLLPGLLF